MKRYSVFLFLLWGLLMPCFAGAAFDISPGTQEHLVKILKGLADDHAYKTWCEKDCGQIHRMQLSGKIADGVLKIDIHGHIVGKDNGVVPLFGSVPAVDIVSLKNGEDEVPLVFYNKAYYTLLSPGPFRLTGEITIDRQSSTNFTLPGAVGRVDLDISDQEPLLKSVRWGQIGGSFQIVSATRKDLEDQSAQKEDLRLSITRDFHVARDKTFVYNIRVVGAEAGQVISIPLKHKEKVLQVHPQNAKIAKSKVDFTATGSDNSFVIEGEWQLNEIKLTAQAGTVKETWRVECEGAYDCQFKGDVEKSVVSEGHEWIPIAGQTLAVTWAELGLLKGQSIVAQEVLLNTQYTGKGLKQKMWLNLKSSAADQVYVDLPKNAIPTTLTYGGAKSPILKNDKGLVHLTVPQGDTRVQLDWEIAKRENRKIPIPNIGLPAGKWVFWATPNKNENAILTGGMEGSPVVLFWPRLGFCLFLAFLFLFTEKKLLKKKETNWPLFLVLCAGFALESPVMILFVLAYLAAIRLLKKAKEKRTVLGWMFEGSIVVILLVTVLGSYFEILHKAFFTSSPFQYESFCSGTAIMGQYKSYGALCWEATIVQSVKDLTSPYMYVLPTLAVRVVYFFWALIAGFYFYLELKNLWAGVKHYYEVGTRPVFKKRQKAKG